MNINSKFMGAIAATDCIICREFEGVRTPGHVHHIADGTNPRSDLMSACLCELHHTGELGVHGMGVKQFCRLYRLPNEFYLIGLQHKYMMIDGLIKVSK